MRPLTPEAYVMADQLMVLMAFLMVTMGYMMPVMNVPTYGTQIVGQYAVGLLLEICAHYGAHDQADLAGSARQQAKYSRLSV